MELTNKNVFVTGSSRGIGLAIAHKFASLGANVVLNGRGQLGQDLLDNFAGYGVKVLAISGDISSAQDAKRMVTEAIETLGSVDILVNNAGITKDGMALRMTEEDFDRVLKVNLTGTFNMTQAVLKPMTKAREGAIINLSSVSGLIGNAGQANYAASKAGVIGFTKAIAREVAGRNVRVNAIAPGVIDTPMWGGVDALFAKYEHLAIGEKKIQVGKAVPLGYMGAPSDIAGAVVFLASDEASYITAQTLNVDGGNWMS